ncbi:uncharacterized protein SAPINGB_P003703 [Magnusiomyces paraingens]|uniref:Ubiquitin-like domain-containing protein n=1 Tax=Magnusiomyces paraingens TaxID=2606893 RepID=A0A5E8BY57_9ASCO|nr:uncharacterized protein SAPINGB_P003703 [Saprochaete ingens]VVT53695.1 unnamed protein product [Saprochaete ingens]
MSNPVPITIRFKYNSITVYVSIKPTETVVDLKEKLAEALNETKVLNRKIKTISTKKLLGEPGDDEDEDEDEDDEEEEDIDIPMPSFATSSSSTSKKEQNKQEKINEKDEAEQQNKKEPDVIYSTILPENIKVGRPIRENDVTSGFTEIKSTANGKPQKLELAGITSNMTLAFTPTQENDFVVNVMADDYYRDDD